MRKRIVSACLEIGSESSGAFLPHYPGCWVFGKTPRSALQKAARALDGWHLWMRRHGEEVSSSGQTVEIGDQEILRVSYDPIQSGKPEPLFWSEVLPIEAQDIQQAKRLMGYARQDLLHLVEGLPPETLDWRPADAPRSIGHCLEHIARVEWWYLTRLEVDLSEDLPENVWDLLEVTRKMVWEGLDRLPPEKFGGVFQPKKYVDSEALVCNLWTARKVLRRFVDHERLHTRYIEKIVESFQQQKTSSER